MTVLPVALALALGAGRTIAPPAVSVYPSGATVPQDLLRISLVFARAVPEEVAGEVRLRAQNGEFVARPFADPVLWSADRKIVSLLLDPSRQKLGLANHVRYHFVLRPHERTQLLLGARVVRTWDVTARSCPPLDPSRWRIAAVRAASRDALIVRFSAPIDVRSADYLAVAARDGARIVGRATLANFERTWRFVPTRPWHRGVRLAIHPRLEDPCGNEIDEPFEHVPGRALGSARATTFERIPMR